MPCDSGMSLHDEHLRRTTAYFLEAGLLKPEAWDASPDTCSPEYRLSYPLLQSLL